jgi:hypothetical protein
LQANPVKAVDVIASAAKQSRLRIAAAATPPRDDAARDASVNLTEAVCRSRTIEKQLDRRERSLGNGICGTLCQDNTIETDGWNVL